MLAKHNIHKKKVNSVPGNNARNCNEHSMEDNNENTGNDNKGNPDSSLNINCICQQSKHTTMISCLMCCELIA